MKILLGLAFLVSMTTLAAAANYAHLSNEELVDTLTAVDCPAPGLNGTGNFQAFIADGSAPMFRVGVLGQPAPCVPPQMRELVRRGPDALPTLIRHIDDARTTKLVVGGTFGNGIPYMFQEYADEYDPRLRAARAMRPAPDINEWDKYDFNGKYAVKVGDVCFALIGEIVNRNLVAVRYQPTAGLIVNSPLQRSSLGDRVKADWGDVDSGGLKSSLLSDLRSAKGAYEAGPALVRLRFYFPATYAALEGNDLSKRLTFEKSEHAR